MPFALKFISGKYQGGQFPLQEGARVVVGRSSGLDMVLVEEMVSRQHAAITLAGGEIQIEDLGSTNGTFVNGERIKKVTVRENDRILIGSNILKVISASNTADPAASRRPLAPPVPKAARRGPTTPEARMAGNLEDISLSDLLQLLGVSRKSGVLTLKQRGTIGRLMLKEGRVQQAELETSLGEQLPIAPLKIAYRLLTWEAGTFELGPEPEAEATGALDLGIQELLMEGFRQKDELARVVDDLPSEDTVIKADTHAKLSELRPIQLDVWQAAANSQTIGAALNGSPHPDAETATAILELLDRGYLRIEKAS